MGKDDAAMQDRNAVRKKNAEALRKAWKKFIKKQEAKREH